MEINLVAVLVATVAMFATGAVWYGALFGKVWGEIHGFDKLSAKKQKELQSQMAIPYVGQLVVTFLTACALAFFFSSMPDTSSWLIAFVIWLGFMVQVTYGALVFGGSPEGQVTRKLLISLGGSLAAIVVGTTVLGLF